MLKFIWTIAQKIAAFSAVVAGVSWILGQYKEVEKILIDHAGITIILILVYAVFYFLMYGGKEEEYKEAYRKRLYGGRQAKRSKTTKRSKK